MTKWWSAVVLSAFLLAAPMVAGHGASPPPDWEKRLLHDCVDDYHDGHGDWSQDGFDVHALDVSESYDVKLGHIVGLRVIYEGGYAGSAKPELALRFTFSSDGSHTFTARTTTLTSFTHDFDGLIGPNMKITASGGADGERRALTGLVKASALGTAISGYQVEALVGGEVVDVMDGEPGGGLLEECQDNFKRADYTLRGTGYHADLTAPSSQQLTVGEETFISLNVKNPFGASQEFTIDAEGAADMGLRFHDESYRPTPYVFVLAGKASKTFHLAATPEGAGTSSVELDLRTDKGGRITASIDLDAKNSATAPSPTPSPSPVGSGDPTPPDEEAPGPGVVALLAVLALAARRRP